MEEDPFTHEITKRQWDSAYHEVVDVIIDKNQKIIRFMLQKKDSVGIRPPELVYTYPFDEGKIAYVTPYASHVTMSFRLDGNSLYTNYSSLTGYGPNSPNKTEVSIKFAGQLIK